MRTPPARRDEGPIGYMVELPAETFHVLKMAAAREGEDVDDFLNDLFYEAIEEMVKRLRRRVRA